MIEHLFLDVTVLLRYQTSSRRAPLLTVTSWFSADPAVKVKELICPFPRHEGTWQKGPSVHRQLQAGIS
jgi:hypothetical protein